jgi:UPF0755 protein
MNPTTHDYFVILSLFYSMTKEIPIKKLAVYLIFSTLLITFVFYGYQIVYTPNVLVDKGDKLFVIHTGDDYRKVLENLNSNGYVGDLVSFSFLARLMSLDEEIHPGRYYLKGNMTNIEAIRALKSGRHEVVKVTFTYVRLRDELAEKITKNIGVTSEEFQSALTDFISAPQNTEGFTKNTILCMFIPNTYEIYYNISPEDFISRMHQEYERFWNDSRKQKATNLGLTPIQVSILASIVQAETTKNSEAPRIAGLYINRLKKGMPLQADPTLVYAAGDFSLKRVLNEHKEVDSPYNTYKYTGLPPGPINVPQIAMIDAVLDYEKHSYLYMCAKEDFSGFHNFATTLAEHNKNARAYQRALAIEIQKGAARKK